MKSSHLFIGLHLLLAGGLHAQDPFTLEANSFLFSQGDFNADARRDVVIVDRTTGAVRLVTQQSNGSFTWGESQPSGIDKPEALSVGKYYNASNDAIAIGSSAANRIHLFGLTNPAEIFTPKVIYPNSPGPSSLAAFDIDATGSADMVAICEGVAPLTNKGFGRVYEGITSLTSLNPTVAWTTNFSSITERINPVRLKAGVAPRIAEIYYPAGSTSAIFYLETVGPTGVSGALNGGTVPSDSRYSIGSLDATGLTHVMFWSPGQPNLRTVRANEATPGTFTMGALTNFSLGSGIQLVVPVQSGAGARIAVLFTDGTAKVYDFDGTNAPVERASITGFPGDLILPLEGSGFLVASGLRGTSPQWRRYAPNGAGYQITASGTAPAFRPSQQVSNILFLSAEPFVNEGVSARLLTHFREWTTASTSGGGISWNIQSLGYGGTTSGLGGSQTTTLSASSSGEFPLLNQYSPALSIFSLDNKTGDQLTDIIFDPPAGNYSPLAAPPSIPGAPAPTPLSVVNVRISATESGYTLYYRTSPTADYQTVPISGRIGINTTTTLQVYGKKTGERTPVRSATYTITAATALGIPSSPDLDADGLPDAWEAAFNLTDPTGDADMDGYSNLEEANNAGDPGVFGAIPTIAPRLSGNITGSGPSKVLRLEWPAGDTASLLQSSINLTTWADVLTSPSIVGNMRRFDVPLTNPEQKRFYRLKR